MVSGTDSLVSRLFLRQKAEGDRQYLRFFLLTCFVFRPGVVDTRMQEQARGGAAKHLHQVFRPWKDRGELLTPEQSAAGLLRALGASQSGRFSLNASLLVRLGLKGPYLVAQADFYRPGGVSFRFKDEHD